MKTFKEEYWSLKLFLKYYFKQMNLLKILILILIILLGIITFFVDAPWNSRIIIFGFVIILTILRRQYLTYDHIHLYKIETKKRIDEKLKENEIKKETTTLK